MFARFGAHKPVWEREAKGGISYGMLLRKKIEVDTVVIGAGITGLTCAINLAESGQSVAVLTESHVGCGDSGRTSAHVISVPDLELNKLIDKFGTDKASLVIRSLENSIDRIENLSGKSRDKCFFNRTAGYKFTEDKKHVEGLEKEYEASRKLGMKTDLLDSSPLPFKVEKAIQIDNQAQFHPLLYLHHLARQVTKHGGKIYENTKVQEISGNMVKTEFGEVHAKQIVVATHSPIGKHISIHTRIAPYFTYVLGVRLKGQAPQGLFWDTNNPYYYIRNYNVEDQKMLIVGGRDHKTGQEEKTYDRYLELENYVRDRFDVADISFYWGGEVFESVDGLPYIGKLPLSQNLFIATGYAGVGLTFGTLGGTIISDKILGRENIYEDLYDPSRVKPLASAARFAKENANVAKWMVSDWLSRDDHTFLSEIPLDSGKLIEGPFQKIAVYKDDQGQVHAMSPVCEHLGGIVHWNEAEKTWDCPCHGSRFQAKGQLICGPALKDLEPVPLDEKQLEDEEVVDGRDLPPALARGPTLSDTY